MLQIYTQLSKLLSKVFFPSDDPALQALSFWGVYAVGFLSRPAGAVLFGHLGDTKGRGFCLLMSVLVMGIPTVLIGCLPSYAQAGYASPIMLAVLRLIQGVWIADTDSDSSAGVHTSSWLHPAAP